MEDVKWPVQVLLLHVTGSRKGSGLSEELLAAQLNSLQISLPSSTHCRVECGANVHKILGAKVN